MTKQEQIAQIAKVTEEICVDLYCVRTKCSECEFFSQDFASCREMVRAKALYNEGYRRQDEVAREIIQVIDDFIEEPVSEYHKGYVDALMDWKKAIEKKYEVKKDDNV